MGLDSKQDVPPTTAFVEGMKKELGGPNEIKMTRGDDGMLHLEFPVAKEKAPIVQEKFSGTPVSAMLEDGTIKMKVVLDPKSANPAPTTDQ
jgi:hypothetical protein